MSEPLPPELTTGLGQLLELLARQLLQLQRQLEPPPPASNEGSPWMGIEKAAAYLDWPRQRLYKLTAQGAIPHYKHEGKLLFHRPELDHWLHSSQQTSNG